MRILILIACLFAFTAGSFSGAAHASIADHNIEFHQIDLNHDDHDEPCHSEKSEQHCDDCCCTHLHTLAIPFGPEDTAFSVSKIRITLFSDRQKKSEPGSLYKPPRL